MLHSENIPSQNILTLITCPISKLIFLDPVTVSTGQVYERQMVERLIADAEKENKIPICPVTKQPIASQILTPTYLVKSMVDVYLLKYPNARGDQYQLINSHEANEQEKTFEKERASEINRQIKEDEALARELQTRFLHEGSEREERERRSLAAFREKRIREMRLRDQASNNRATNIAISAEDKYKRDILIKEIQNLIHGLGFNNQGSGEEIPAFYAFNFIAELFSSTSCSITGPISAAMHEVLKAAVRALRELDPDILKNAKQQYAGQYDLVQPWLGEKVSLGMDSYASFAKSVGTVNNQSGDLVQQMLVRVEQMLQDLCSKYKNNVAEIEIPQRRFGN